MAQADIGTYFVLVENFFTMFFLVYLFIITYGCVSSSIRSAPLCFKMLFLTALIKKVWIIIFNFFFILRKAFFWISKGTVAINGLIGAYGNFKAQLNYIIAVIVHIPLFKKYLMRRWVVKKHNIKYHKSLNYSEFNYGCSSGIILKLLFRIKKIKSLKKRRKTWSIYNKC